MFCTYLQIEFIHHREIFKTLSGLEQEGEDNEGGLWLHRVLIYSSERDWEEGKGGEGVGSLVGTEMRTKHNMTGNKLLFS